MINFLLKNIFDFHRQLDADAGIRDIGLIESAVNAPFQSFGGQDLYPTIFDKAARLFFGLTMNHGFIDGNKRVAAHATLVFLRIHDLIFTADDDETYSVSIAVAKGLMTPDEIKQWLIRNVAGKIFITKEIVIFDK